MARFSVDFRAIETVLAAAWVRTHEHAKPLDHSPDYHKAIGRQMADIANDDTPLEGGG